MRRRSFFTHWMMPKAAIADPELAVGLPPFLTMATGMDALSHCFEAYCEGADPCFSKLPLAIGYSPANSLAYAHRALAAKSVAPLRIGTISFKVAWPVLAAISCGTLGAPSNALLLPSCPGSAAGMVRAWHEILAALKIPLSGPSVA
jgi:Iron-containing alcohol dehydrogenase